MGAASSACRRVFRCDGGVSAVEFAIAAPLVFLLLAALFEIGFILTANLFLEAGAHSAGRFGITGAILSGQTREDRIREIVTEYVCPKSLPSADSSLCFWTTESIPAADLHDGSPLQITTLAYTDPRNVGVPEPFSDLAPENGTYDAGEAFTDINGNGVWDPDMGVASAGGSSDVVVYRVAMPQRLVTPLIRTVFGNSLYWHRTQVVVRNEPF
jgi:hypothetical protein